MGACLWMYVDGANTTSACEHQEAAWDAKWETHHQHGVCHRNGVGIVILLTFKKVILPTICEMSTYTCLGACVCLYESYLHDCALHVF